MSELIEDSDGAPYPNSVQEAIQKLQSELSKAMSGLVIDYGFSSSDNLRDALLDLFPDIDDISIEQLDNQYNVSFVPKIPLDYISVDISTWVEKIIDDTGKTLEQVVVELNDLIDET